MALKKCKSCGKDVDSTATKCPNCGAATTVGSLQSLGCLMTIGGIMLLAFAIAIGFICC